MSLSPLLAAILAALLLSGCIPVPKAPARQDPFAGLGLDTRPAAYGNLTLDKKPIDTASGSVDKRYTAWNPSAAGRFVEEFAAASADEITGSEESRGHGSFTYHFLKGLSGAAKDAHGRVTAKGLFSYLKPKVQDEARRQNRDQTPSLAMPEGDVLLR